MNGGPMKLAAARWTLFAIALLAALFSLLTALPTPLWLPWELGLVVSEIGLWVAPVALCVGVVAWLLRRKHLVVATGTLILCAITLVLLLKPAVQAWRLGSNLPAQFTAAFGPTPPSQPPFSFAASFAPAPEPVPIRTMRYSDSLLLDFYPALGSSPAPCVIALHGGGYTDGDRKDGGTNLRLNNWLARHGYAVASIDYRLAPKYTWPAQRDNVLAALAFLHAQAQSLNIDPGRVVLLGWSGGGGLAAATGYWAHDSSIRGVIVLYAPTDYRLSWDASTDPNWQDHRPFLQMFLGGTPDTSSAAYDSASATLLVTARTPPTLILQGQLDMCVLTRQSELLDQRLAAAGVPHLLVRLPWAAHAFDFVSLDTPGGQIATYAVGRFLSAVTR
jgi:acetyl esterase/lipase